VSLLEALASAGHSRGRVLAALDGGRNEVFVGEYKVEIEGPQLIRERLLTRDGWLEAAVDAAIVTADSSLADAVRAKGLPLIKVERPRSDAIAKLGWKKIARGETVSAEALEANYTGRSEADLFVKGG
jgi:tRNA A37 threonylcarbamoyladenosine modification protein TsaB